ncbi:uncharacterized protein LOC141851903 [Brevipalpus obovatus]|uniref:uncharacterized protein LOC141851903 n=1 Tax=Brevipalpus obovatus TaxID=246614 RepID=UPI003D9EAD24
MRKLYQEYPEILFIDSTYKINQNRMVLMVMMIVDGNGESGLAALSFLRSESEDCTRAALESFKKVCGNVCDQTKTIMADKDMGIRKAFQSTFPHTNIHICIFHVLQTFKREITCGKRNLKVEEKDEALKILRDMVYAETEDVYNSLYNSLHCINSPELNHYFDSNWHPIREQWTMYGQSNLPHFRNRTNNRLERFNRDLHDTTPNYGNIVDAFKSVMNASKAHRIERHKRALDSIYKQPTKSLEPLARQYKDLLTNFAYDHVMLQYDVSKRLCDRIQIGSPTLYVRIDRTYQVSVNNCECSSFNVMHLPCRHIFALHSRLEKDLYLPELCSSRWYLSKFEHFRRSCCDEESSPVNTSVNPFSQNDSETLSSSQRFREMKDCAMNLVDVACQQPPELYSLFLTKTKNLKDELLNLISNSISVSDDVPSDLTNDSPADPKICICGLNACDDLVNHDNSFTCPHCQRWCHFVCNGTLDCFSSEYLSQNDVNGRVGCHRCPVEQYSCGKIRDVSNQERMRIVYTRIALKTIVLKNLRFPALREIISPLINELNQQDLNSLIQKYFLVWQRNYEAFSYDSDHESPIGEKSLSPFYLSPPVSPQPISATIIERVNDHNYEGDLKHLQLPPVPLNIRPCPDKSSKTSRKTCLKTFQLLSNVAKKKRIIVWMFGEQKSKPIINGKVQISADDLNTINDLVWQKLRNEEVDLDILDTLFESDAFQALKKKVTVQLKRKRWICRNCKKVTSSGKSILCDCCLDWLHFRCVGLTSMPKKEMWMCPDCVELK